MTKNNAAYLFDISKPDFIEKLNEAMNQTDENGNDVYLYKIFTRLSDTLLLLHLQKEHLTADAKAITKQNESLNKIFPSLAGMINKITALHEDAAITGKKEEQQPAFENENDAQIFEMLKNQLGFPKDEALSLLALMPAAEKEKIISEIKKATEIKVINEPAVVPEPVSQPVATGSQPAAPPIPTGDINRENPKCAVAIYYSYDVLKRYSLTWLHECFESILADAEIIKNFEFYELVYGKEVFPADKAYHFSNYLLSYKIEIELLTKNKPDIQNHVAAQNFLFDWIFQTVKTPKEIIQNDVVFNINIDDFYHADRFKLQLKAIKKGFDLISSNYMIVADDGKAMSAQMFNDYLPFIDKHCDAGTNILAHPVIAMTRKFWERNRPYDEQHFIEAKKKGISPMEDFIMWKKAVKNKEKIQIVPEILLYHRIHRHNTGN